MHSIYMLYGGTNWGGLSYSGVATSYDYSSPIQEDRQILAKYSESKLLGLQLRASRDLTKTQQLGRGVSHTNVCLGAIVSDSAVEFILHEQCEYTCYTVEESRY